MDVRKISYTLIFLSAISIGDQAKSDESTNGSIFEATLAVLQGEMYIAGAAALTSKEPEDWGKYCIFMSALLLVGGDAIQENNVWESKEGYLLTVAGLAGYGNWLIDQEGEEESELAKTQFLGLSVLLWSVAIYQYAFDSDRYAEQSQFLLETDPIDHGIRLTYKIDF